MKIKIFLELFRLYYRQSKIDMKWRRERGRQAAKGHRSELNPGPLQQELSLCTCGARFICIYVLRVVLQS